MDRVAPDDIRAVLQAEDLLVFHDAMSLGDDDDLFAAGLTSMASVQLLLAVEDRFGVEVPDELLSRDSFRSVRRIAKVVNDATQADRLSDLL